MVDAFLAFYFQWLVWVVFLILGYTVNIGMVIYFWIRCGKPPRDLWLRLFIAMVLPYGFPLVVLWELCMGQIKVRYDR